MAQSGKGVYSPHTLLASAQGTTQDTGSHLLSKTHQAELTFLVLETTGSHILCLVSLTRSEDHLSWGFSNPSSQAMIPGSLLEGRGHRSTSNKTGLICLFYLTCCRETLPIGVKHSPHSLQAVSLAMLSSVLLLLSFYL